MQPTAWDGAQGAFGGLTYLTVGWLLRLERHERWGLGAAWGLERAWKVRLCASQASETWVRLVGCADRSWGTKDGGSDEVCGLFRLQTHYCRYTYRICERGRLMYVCSQSLKDTWIDGMIMR